MYLKSGTGWDVASCSAATKTSLFYRGRVKVKGEVQQSVEVHEHFGAAEV